MTDRYDELRRLISRLTGLRERAEGMNRLDEVLAARIHALHLTSPEEYEELLESGNSMAEREIRELAAKLTPGETHFFRDRGQFELLERVILPALIQEKSATKQLRIWSAGCATGEEVYSIAMVLDSLLPDPKDWKIAIRGTDINPDALEKARAGVYTDWSFRVMSCAKKTAYFRQTQSGWRLKDDIRRAVQFDVLDLIHDGFPSTEVGIGEVDLIICRNVFIYFQPDSVRSVASKMAASLRPGGYLITAHGELQGVELEDLEVVSFVESALYRRAARRSPTSSAEPNPPRIPNLSAGLVPVGPRDLQPDTSVSAIDQRARALANRGLYEEAEKLCADALRRDPFSAGTYYLLSRIAEERKQRELSKAMLKKVLYLDAAYVAAYLDLAALYDAENNGGRARRLRHSAIECLLRPDVELKLEGYEISTPADLLSSLEALVGGENQ